MFKTNMAAVLVLASALVAPATSFADSHAHARSCILQGHRVSSVRSYDAATVGLGHATVTKHLGAQLYVPAGPGLTAEWLRVELGRELAQMRANGMKDCPLGDIHAEVDSAGAGFSVKLTARDPAKAADLLMHAQMLFQ
jgi:hypothetical protein